MPDFCISNNEILTFVTKNTLCEIEYFQNTLYMQESTNNIRRETMTFMAQYSQFMLIKLEANEMKHKQLITQGRMTQLSKERSLLEEQYQSIDISDESEYNVEDQAYCKYLEHESNRLEILNETYSEQLEELNTMANNLKSQVNNGIKDSCSMTFSGGGK